MGTGLGPESYAIIEQGRIGQILSSKPQDRRAVIEEAAGITKFKTQEAAGRSQARKREAESGARVRHSGRSHAAGEFAQAAGLQGQALRRAEDARWMAQLRDRARRPVPAAGARRRQDRARSEPGHRRFQDALRRRWPSTNRNTRAAAGTAATQPKRELTEAREQLAELQRGSGAHARPPGIAGQADRRDRAADRAGRDGVAGSRRAASQRSTRSSQRTGRSAGRARSADRRGARALAARRTQEREALQAQLREREQDHRSGPASRFCGCWAKPPR